MRKDEHEVLEDMACAIADAIGFFRMTTGHVPVVEITTTKIRTKVVAVSAQERAEAIRVVPQIAEDF